MKNPMYLLCALAFAACATPPNNTASIDRPTAVRAAEQQPGAEPTTLQDNCNCMVITALDTSCNCLSIAPVIESCNCTTPPIAAPCLDCPPIASTTNACNCAPASELVCGPHCGCLCNEPNAYPSA